MKSSAPRSNASATAGCRSAERATRRDSWYFRMTQRIREKNIRTRKKGATRMYSTERVVLCIGAFAVQCVWALTANAQQEGASSDASPKEPKASKAEIETIVVNATKRQEDVAKIPLSVTVIGSEALEGQHITSFADLTRSVPNLSFAGGGEGGGWGVSNIELRGMSSQAGSSTVGVYLDDVSISVRNLYSLGSAEPKFFDIDHIEVLRGPQGTLYGASSMGGTIKFVSNQPNAHDVESSCSAEFSSTEHGGTSSMLNGVYNAPLVRDILALRMGVQVAQAGGYIDQVSHADPPQVIAKGINS